MRHSTAATTSIAAIALLGSIQPGWAAPTFEGQTVLGINGAGDQEPPSHPIPEKPDTGMFNPLHRRSRASILRLVISLTSRARRNDLQTCRPCPLTMCLPKRVSVWSRSFLEQIFTSHSARLSFSLTSHPVAQPDLQRHYRLDPHPSLGHHVQRRRSRRVHATLYRQGRRMGL
jgi:hypothetical protein